MKKVIIIPAFNEAVAIGPIVESAVAVADAVIVIDDGSRDDTSAVATKGGAMVVRHAVNRGVGGATGTGLQAALRLGADLVVSMDADGQHRAEDAARLFQRLAQGDIDFVNGSRLLARREGIGKMPWSRVLFNTIANILTFVLFGVWVTDSQCGLRGMTRRAAEILDLRTNGFEVCSEMIQQVKRHGWRYAEVPIPAIYTEYSMSKGQSLGNGVRTAARLLLRRFIG